MKLLVIIMFQCYGYLILKKRKFLIFSECLKEWEINDLFVIFGWDFNQEGRNQVFKEYRKRKLIEM